MSTNRLSNRRPWKLWLPALIIAVLMTNPASLLACTACFGKSDSPMARGMNWGIASLLVVVGVVLSGIATFFVYLARKSAASDAAPPAGKGLSTTNH